VFNIWTAAKIEQQYHEYSLTKPARPTWSEQVISVQWMQQQPGQPRCAATKDSHFWIFNGVVGCLSVYDTSWLAAAIQMTTRQPNVQHQDFTPDAVPDATLPTYPGLGPAHSMLDCTHWGLVQCHECKPINCVLQQVLNVW